MLMRLYYHFVFIIEARIKNALLLVAGSVPIAVARHVDILTVFVKEHTAVRKEHGKAVIVPILPHNGIKQAVV